MKLISNPKYLLVLFAFSFLFFGCKEDVKEGVKCKLEISQKKVKQGDLIDFKLSTVPIYPNARAKYYFDGEEIKAENLKIEDLRVGKHRLEAEMLIADSILCEAYKTIEVVSDIEPEQWSYEIIVEYPHQISAYTQGLAWHEGNLYEGTGRYEHSLLAEVDLETGNYLRSLELDDSYFGEGVTILNGNVYQLTWQAQKCFVYDLESFDLIDEFEFNSREGWGLTNDGKNLIMSDGSHYLSILDPRDLKELNKIEIYKGKKRLNALNELEFANGLLYANVYQTEDIAVIDLNTGKVLAMIDCRNLLDPKSVKSQIDVLNGIAHNPEKDHFYLTGKWWPTLFEVKLNQSSPTP